MTSPSGRFVIVFNGEIYNHLALRAELGPRSWRGHSDTETLLEGIERWGLVETLKKSVGMFALGLWDRQERELVLARDRMGEKPLYYGWQGSAFVFGSELKALRMHPQFRGEIEREALPLYMRHGTIPAPYSIYRGIRKLQPGTVIKIPITTSPGTLPKPLPYWSLYETVLEGRSRPFPGNDAEALAELERTLGEAVRLQRLADVPLGAFLSGGIDSSAVVALMQAQSARPVKSFTIGFRESSYDEAPYARAVARHLGTDHTELYVTPTESLEVIPKLPFLYDEPFGDSSQIPTYLVAQLARRHVTVSLSGDGGDELFGGYSRYFTAPRIWRAMRNIPATARRTISHGIRLLSPEVLTSLFDPIMSWGRRGSKQAAGDRLYVLAAALECGDTEHFYRLMTSQWYEPAGMCSARTIEPPSIFTDAKRWPDIGAFEERMMYADALQYLPDDILVKVDRAAMAVSLETRVPMLDHRVVEFAWRLPSRFKIRHGVGKWLLRQLVHQHLPKELLDRPKKGFGVPVDHWLRGPLREWAEDLLSEERLKRDGFFAAGPIRRRWREHVTGRCNWRDSLWVVLMFQAWLQWQQAAPVQDTAEFGDRVALQ